MKPACSSKKTPRVSIALVNWNAAAETAVALEALRGLAFDGFETVVTDNGSTDDSPRTLSARFPEAVFLSLPENRGFGAACNLALRRAREQGTPFVWLLNNDAVPDPGALTAMMRLMESDPRIAGVGSLVRNMDPPQAVQAWGGGVIHPWTAIVRMAKTVRPGPLPRSFFLTGASLLLRMEAEPLFDENFFLYWEDADLCFRLRREGWKLAVATDAVIWHKGSATTGKMPRMRSFHSGRSMQLFYRRHERFPWWKGLLAVTFQSALKCLRGNFSAAAGFWQGRAAADAPPRFSSGRS